ncbi:MAG: LuxR family transcriptional regulator [Nostocoides sp.]
MSNEVHEPQARPDHPEVVDLTQLADVLLQRAGTDSQRRASHLVVNGPAQRAVLMAILAGSGLGEHASPPAATLHVLRGRVRLHAGDTDAWLVHAGQVVPVPPDRHAVDALEDSVILLTVALQP